ncbi:hypothetical protein DRJ17_03250 [Candidatus Woesearchaeota archaeon]|nr:MAG: hypothetical protein DRJ17_03250 [Candidatus Woesearchaeota archaeon]
MRMPQEIEVWFVLPAIRKELAKAMIVNGATQREIAKIMGITEAAVSQYMKGKRATEVQFSKDIKMEIEKTARAILKEGGKYMCEMNRLMRLSAIKKIVCKIHKNDVKDLPEKCKVCLERLET